jgi:hypothetical protein
MAKFKDNMKEKWSRFKKRVGKIFKRDPGIQEITDISLPPQDPPPRPARPRDSQIPAELLEARNRMPESYYDLGTPQQAPSRKWKLFPTSR